MRGSLIYHQLRLPLYTCCFLDLPHGWWDVKSARVESQLWMVTAGGAYLHIGDRQYRIAAGDFCLLPDTQPVAYGCDRETHIAMWVVECGTELLSGSLFDWIDCDEWVVKPPPKLWEQGIQRMQNMRTAYPHGLPLQKQLSCLRDLHSLTGDFLELAQVREKQKQEWLQQTLTYIDRHLDGDLSVGALARQAALHPNYFSRQFHRQLGISPSQYVADIRCRTAQALLLEKKLSVQEVAACVGMSDMQQFVRLFKRLLGVTPYQYLKTN